jgi:hypothetical protein
MRLGSRNRRQGNRQNRQIFVKHPEVAGLAIIVAQLLGLQHSGTGFI